MYEQIYQLRHLCVTKVSKHRIGCHHVDSKCTQTGLPLCSYDGHQMCLRHQQWQWIIHIQSSCRLCVGMTATKCVYVINNDSESFTYSVMAVGWAVDCVQVWRPPSKCVCVINNDSESFTYSVMAVGWAVDCAQVWRPPCVSTSLTMTVNRSHTVWWL